MIKERLAALRALMQANNLTACIVPGTDPHASEYMAPHWTEMSWITGFLGETGTAVITLDQALLWTDSRYYLQAEAELQGTTVELMRESDIDCPTIPEWLCTTIGSQTSGRGKVAVNPEMYSVNGYRALKAELEEGGLELVSIDLISPLWTEGRPAIPTSVLYEYSEQYAGESTQSKLQRVRQAMLDKHCQALVVSALDEIGWLLNIRGKDVDYTPCLISYVVVEMDKCTIFVAPSKLDQAAHNYLASIPVDVKDYDQVFDYLQHISVDSIIYDGGKVNEALYEAINPNVSKRVNMSPSPVLKMQCIKNQVELNGERTAMLKDAVALTKFLYWLENEALSIPQTEITLARKLAEFRAMDKNYTDDSFCTIAGWKGNGAIVHYQATPETCAKIEGDGVLLLDSGGQYLDGTTDITRTIWVGNTAIIPDAVKRDYTAVLKGHIALACARFPKGTRGNQLDVLARQFLWAEGMTYGHGTGHGVGHFMGCHEGPQNIRTDNNPTPLQVGNICSDEPGIYRANEYGIRIENLIAVCPATQLGAHTTGETFYEFETLTLCYYDTHLIDLNRLTAQEKEWINAYHERVYRNTAPYLTTQEAQWLKDKCKAL
ncbi:MAG: aminopeptidase P family protein [Paludibacteraceae bacterium]|nr:aminopeptidase P family protein [Paludibacteraceae bacterium]